MANVQLKHGLGLPRTLDEAARHDFVSALRGFILHDMANDMRATYEHAVRPAEVQRTGREPATSSEVHAAMRGQNAFKFYSAMRVNAQEMVWDSVRDQVVRQREHLNAAVGATLDANPGLLELKPGFKVPRSVSALDVHLMPGNYDSEYGPGDATQGSLYDHGTNVFFMGLLGEDGGDIGRSIARFVKLRYPDFHPQKILDLGCSIGHNSIPWAQEFPDAELHALDVAAPALRYGAARAAKLGANARFHQMDAVKLDFPDESFDIVWSSMFFHEIPLKNIPKILKECHRVLKKGGLMVHMELPPNKALPAYDGFYLDWDSWYNEEPFYKTFRDQDPQKLCADAGFAPERFQEFVVPSLVSHGEDAMRRAVDGHASIDKDTGRLAAGISWYSFGAWK
jgi:SAM-dependent methyltransferase/phage tail protein X